LMWVGLVVLIIGLGRLALSGNRQRKYSLGRIGGYEVLLPKWSLRNGRWYLDLGWFTLPGTFSQPTSPVPGSPNDEHVSFLPFEAPSDLSTSTDSLLNGRPSHPLVEAVRRAGHRAVTSLTASRGTAEGSRRRGRHGGSRGVLFFLPAIFTQSQEIELSESHRSSPPDRIPFQRTVSRASQLPPEKQRYAEDIERAGLFGDDFSIRDDVPSRALSRQASESDCPTPSTLIDVGDRPSSRVSRSSSRNS
jgi:inositol phosphorylceramide mannosyltransferase catalytic subunit